jgi:hypothetical protein
LFSQRRCRITLIFVDKTIAFWLFLRQIEANPYGIGIRIDKSQIFVYFFTIILTWISSGIIKGGSGIGIICLVLLLPGFDLLMFLRKLGVFSWVFGALKGDSFQGVLE